MLLANDIRRPQSLRLGLGELSNVEICSCVLYMTRSIRIIAQLHARAQLDHINKSVNIKFSGALFLPQVHDVSLMAGANYCRMAIICEFNI